MTSSIKPLYLFVDPRWRRKEVHTPLMNPWWGNPFEEQSVFPKQMYDTYSYDVSFYGITDRIEDAEMILVPYRHSWIVQHDPQLLVECERIADKYNLPILIDGMGDIEYPVRNKRAVILRYGGYRFIPELGRVSVPLNTDDLLIRYKDGKLKVRPKINEKPSIGFAGWTNMSLVQYIRTLIKEFRIRLRGMYDHRYRSCVKGVLWRQKIIRILKDSSIVILNLLARSTFSASPKTAKKDIMQLRTEMVDTIFESDYALDVRGDANNSARLFEILSLGRIPIIIDTERCLPFCDLVDYSSFAIIVDFRDVKRLPDIVADFHKKISPEKYESMQINARKAFENFFRIDAQMKYIVLEIRIRMKETTTFSKNKPTR